LAPVKSTIYKIRSILSEASDDYFREQEFTKVHMPMITFSECESGCGVFTVTSFSKTDQLSDFPVKADVLPAQIDFSKDFFGKKSSLTVSSQLELECSLPLGDVYCETRAARCEESMTSRHLCEFTMIEFERPFISSSVDIIDTAEDYVRFMFKRVLEKCDKELGFLGKQFSLDVKERLSHYLEKPFPRITHADAVTLMLGQPDGTFSIKPSYSEDLSTEHEKWLSEIHFKTGVFVCRYPKAVKAFYMPVLTETPEESHGVEHVDSFDFLIDGLELIGGSARIWRTSELESRITELGLDRKPLEYYIGLRRDGSAKSGGLGLGFDRLVKVVTGAPSIKDCVQFPRYVGCA
jgi:asparaginyl-tRNA synthetase